MFVFAFAHTKRYVAYVVQRARLLACGWLVVGGVFLVCWSVGWLVCWSVGWLVGWLVGRLGDVIRQDFNSRVSPRVSPRVLRGNGVRSRSESPVLKVVENWHRAKAGYDSVSYWRLLMMWCMVARARACVCGVLLCCCACA